MCKDVVRWCVHVLQSDPLSHALTCEHYWVTTIGQLSTLTLFTHYGGTHHQKHYRRFILLHQSTDLQSGVGPTALCGRNPLLLRDWWNAKEWVSLHCAENEYMRGKNCLFSVKLVSVNKLKLLADSHIQIVTHCHCSNTHSLSVWSVLLQFPHLQPAVLFWNQSMDVACQGPLVLRLSLSDKALYDTYKYSQSD